MSLSSRYGLLAVALICLGGCESLTQRAAPTPDYRIKVEKSADGRVLRAVPPECPSWADVSLSPVENQMTPQLGCASARNLAAMVENPNDLIGGRPTGRADGELAASTVQRYRAGQSKELIDPNDPSPKKQAGLRDVGLDTQK